MRSGPILSHLRVNVKLTYITVYSGILYRLILHLNTVHREILRDEHNKNITSLMLPSTKYTNM